MKRSRGGRKRRWLGYFLSFLFGVALAIGGYFYFISRELPSPESVDQKDFTQKISLIDQMINGQLFELDLSRKDILLQQSHEKKEGKLVWRQTQAKIQCSRSLSFSAVDGNFKKGIGSLGNPFSIQSVQTPEALRLEIRILNRLTHELTFIPRQMPSSKMGAVPGEPLRPGLSLSPRIAFVIDDLGGDDQVSQELLAWDVPVTFAILPFTPHAKHLASEAHQKGKEVILHLPMEPHGFPRAKPGKGVLLREMSPEKLRRQLLEDIEAVPYIQGVSNHMGSRLMEDSSKLRIILSELKKRDLFFLDSRTTPQTVGLETARSIGLKSEERSVFLDHTQGEEAVKRSLEKLIQVALTTRKAIGIGHPHAATIRSIKAMLPKIQEKGIEIVPLSVLFE